MPTLGQRRPLDLTAVSLEENGSTSAYMTFSLELCPDRNWSPVWKKYNDVANHYLFDWFVALFYTKTEIKDTEKSFNFFQGAFSVLEKDK